MAFRTSILAQRKGHGSPRLPEKRQWRGRHPAPPGPSLPTGSFALCLSPWAWRPAQTALSGDFRSLGLLLLGFPFAFPSLRVNVLICESDSLALSSQRGHKDPVRGKGARFPAPVAPLSAPAPLP